MSASQLPALRPVIRTLYRQLYRVGREYGALTEINSATKQVELDRLIAINKSNQRKSIQHGHSNQSDDVTTGVIPVAPGLMIAIRARPAEDKESNKQSSGTPVKTNSEYDALAEMLSTSSTDQSIEPSDILTPTTVTRMISQLFRQPNTSFDLSSQKLIGVGFLALRTLKERIHAISAQINPSNSMFLQSFVTGEPLLADLSNETTTEHEHVRVHIKTKYARVPYIHSSQSSEESPTRTSYNFSYEITITNTHPSRTVQLLGRKWAFTDSKGICQRIKGDGVIGQTPVLVPNQTFKYESHVNLEQTKGKMEGSFIFQLIEDTQKSSSMKSGDKFEVPVGPVLLAATLKTSSPSQATET